MSRDLRRRPPYRRRDRLGFACTAWLFVFGAILGCALLVLSVPAHSDPGLQVDPLTATYAASNAPRICSTIGTYPSAAGVQGVVEGIVADGLTGIQAGAAIAVAVTARCPQYWPILDQYIAAFTPQRSPSPVHQAPQLGTGVIA